MPGAKKPRKAQTRRRRSPIRPKLPRLPNHSDLTDIYAELLSRPNVEGCFIGRKRTNGRTTGRLSIVCVVREKIADENLDPQKERLPQEVRWGRGKARPGRLSTDVQVLADRFRPAATEVVGPGDRVTAGAPATIGIALGHPIFGNVVTTAGHLLLGGVGEITFAPQQRPPVQLASFPPGGISTGVALRAVRSVLADYALVRPDSLPCQNLYADQTPIARPFLPSDQEIGTPLLVLGTTNGIQQTTFKGLHGLLPVGTGGLMQNLLVTEFVTQPGDSGSCLVDLQSRVWGLLVGFSALDGVPCSVFMSAAIPLALEAAVFL